MQSFAEDLRNVSRTSHGNLGPSLDRLLDTLFPYVQFFFEKICALNFSYRNLSTSAANQSHAVSAIQPADYVFVTALFVWC